MENNEYPFIGQFHWKYFQIENGKRNVAVSSTAPRVEMMMESGLVKHFTDKKRGHNYSVVFDSEYVFDYFYQKIVINMGWVMNEKLDSDVLKCFLDDFLLHCEAVHRNNDVHSIKAQATALALSFPHKTAEQWEKELLGNEENNEATMVETKGNEKVYPVDDIARIEKKTIGVADLGSKAEWQGNVEEDCGDWEPKIDHKDNDIAARTIRDLKQIASRMKIKGYGNMSKDELVAAIICNR